MPYVFRNHLRRVVIGKKPGIFNASRTELYFRLGSNLREPYQEAADAASAGECRQIGLHMDGNYWDYPFFVFLKDRGGESPRLEHLHLRGLSPTDYPLGPFDPCAVIAVNKARGDRLELEGLPVLYRVYERQIQSPLVQNVSVYRLSGFIE